MSRNKRGTEAFNFRASAIEPIGAPDPVEAPSKVFEHILAQQQMHGMMEGLQGGNMHGMMGMLPQMNQMMQSCNVMMQDGPEDAQPERS